MLALAAVVLIASCSGSQQAVTGEGPEAARQRYVNGLRELEGGNYTEAFQQFGTVAASPRYMKLTALASLRAADSLFYQGQYPQALTAYQSFIKRFAGNPNIPYAEFRIAQSHFRRIPSDFFLLPGPHERDLATTRSAYRTLRRFLSRYPRNRFAPQGLVMIEVCARRLYDYEMYAADFYESRDRPRGVAQRLETALADFPRLALTEENLWRLADAYAEIGDAPETRRALERYLSAFPDGERAEEARANLAALEASPAADEDEPPEDGTM